jgi:hypothetical protein
MDSMENGDDAPAPFRLGVLWIIWDGLDTKTPPENEREYSANLRTKNEG